MGNTDGIVEFGHVWDTKQSPTTSSYKTELGTTYNTGSFNSTLSNLTPNTKYYVRAYAINSVGIAYGDEVSFTTQYGVPVVTTNSVNNITHKSATFSGSISYTGGYEIKERGFCWSRSDNPSIEDDNITASSGNDVFTASATGLSENTTYHVRAYIITHDDKIFYGNDIAFSTTERNVNIDKPEYGDETNWN